MDTSTALEASSSPSPSSSSTTSSSSPYDVFLSFSGKDTRKTFTDHLYWTMKDAGIDFFMEENESIRRGENISDKVKQIIEGSRVSVIVFSSRYADSIWCLEELVQIMECRRTLKQMVLPIFYDLSPSDAIGTFVQAFQKHRERCHEDTDIQEKIRRWTDALTEAAGLTVRVFRTTNGYEGMFVREIIDEITRLLKSPTPVGIAFSELQRLRSTEHTDTASSESGAKSALSKSPLKKRCHEPDHSDSTSTPLITESPKRRYANFAVAPTRKAKGVKRYATVNEASPEKYGGVSNKKKQQKRKLSDKLGLQWSNGELQRFYDAYRKYGKDWQKVAAAVRNRSIEMVEALYNMNRAYLSLPEGTASVVGLKAMMTDHYNNVMEGSDSERESSDGVQDRALHLKEKISCCLSSHLLRRWCTFEWFYSALDYPWFAKREFEEYLNHVGQGHTQRLTRVEWGVIRSSLGKPRRFSEHFLHEEREKLKQYRESVRKHYAELRTGVREGLPTDLARPLSVGQRVIALHPKTREVQDGSVLTVDHDKCRVQFDRPDIGVEFVMDVDCMPLNPLDNMPEARRRQNIAFDKSFFTSKEPNKNGNRNFGGLMMFLSSGHLVKATSPVNASIKQGKGDAIHTTAQPKTASADIGRAQQTAYSQPGMVVAHNQAREADIRALSELNRALDKKERTCDEDSGASG